MSGQAILNSQAEPETRNSFLVSMVQGKEDSEWKQFDKLYSPMILGYAKRKGLQDADAQEVLQDVLLQVYKYLPSFEYDRDRGRFRAWLQTITRNQVSRFFKNRKSRRECTGSNSMLDLREAQQFFGSVLLKQITEKAQNDIRDSFQNETWRAFQLTWLEQKSVEDTARLLGRSVGWVYVAKSRVLKKLTQRVSWYFSEINCQEIR